MKSSDSDTAPAALRKRKKGSRVQPEVESRPETESPPSWDMEGNYSGVYTKKHPVYDCCCFFTINLTTNVSRPATINSKINTCQW